MIVLIRIGVTNVVKIQIGVGEPVNIIEDDPIIGSIDCTGYRI